MPTPGQYCLGFRVVLATITIGSDQAILCFDNDTHHPTMAMRHGKAKHRKAPSDSVEEPELHEAQHKRSATGTT